MAKHAKLSPSASSRWMNCPGSVKLIESLNVIDTSSFYADEGTVAHALAEVCSKEGFEPRDFLNKFGKNIPVNDLTDAQKKIQVTENMCDAVQQYLNYISERVSELELEYDLVIEHYEVWCPLDYLNIPGLDGGTSDCVLLCYKIEGKKKVLAKIVVIDYKHGKGYAVEVDNNTQELMYALGAVRLFTKEPVEDGVELVIVQPRAFHYDGPFRHTEIDYFDLEDFEQSELIPKANATLEYNAELVPGDVQCKFCPGKDTLKCPALNDVSRTVTTVDYSDIVIKKEVNQLSNDEIQKIVKHSGVMIDYINAVCNKAATMMINGEIELENKKLVRSRTNRRLIPSIEEALALEFDTDELERFYRHELKSMTDIEKELKKFLDKDEVKTLMDSLTEKPEGAIVIAPINDPRPQVQLTSSAEDDFKNI